MSMEYLCIYFCLIQFLSFKLVFSVNWSFTSLVKCISRYLILLKAIINGIVFLISLSDGLLFVYRKATVVWISVLYFTFIASHSSLVESIRFSTYSSIISSVNGDRFTFFFLIWRLFVYFSCLIALAGTSSITLNRSGKSGHSCLIANLSNLVLGLISKSFQFFTIEYDDSCGIVLRSLFLC